MEITKDGRNIPCHLKQQDASIYSATFTPVTVGHYQIAIAYNKAEIRGKFALHALFFYSFFSFSDVFSIIPNFNDSLILLKSCRLSFVDNKIYFQKYNINYEICNIPTCMSPD